MLYPIELAVQIDYFFMGTIEPPTLSSEDHCDIHFTMGANFYLEGFCLFIIAHFIKNAKYFILSEAELARKGEADGHIFLVMDTILLCILHLAKLKLNLFKLEHYIVYTIESRTRPSG